MKIFIIVFIFLFLLSGLFRCFLFNIHRVGFYTVYDFLKYVYLRQWKNFDLYGIDMFVGMFGSGKSLSMTHRARQIYKQYGNSVRFVSNYKLYGIPYVPLVNFNQLLELDEDLENSGIVGTVVLIDEIEDVLSHRNYSNFPLQLLNVLTQQRKKKVYIMCTAQRFFMVDKIFRSITTHVIDCSKFWRFARLKYYDAWDYENAMNSQLLGSISTSWWFVRNKDYSCYDTEQMISENMSKDFLSNEEHLARIGLDNVVNEQAIQRGSRKLKRNRKKNK